MTAALSEQEMARRLFGDLADDVLLLRAQGHTVARYRGDYRVDRDILSYEAVEARASVLRKTLQEKKDSRAARADDGAAEPVQVGRRRKAKAPEAVAGAAGGADAPAPIQGGSDAPSVENVREGPCPERGAPPAVADDISARLARLEERVELLFAIVAEAVEVRRDTLIEQAAGLEKLTAALRL